MSPYCAQDPGQDDDAIEPYSEALDKRIVDKLLSEGWLVWFDEEGNWTARKQEVL